MKSYRLREGDSYNNHKGGSNELPKKLNSSQIDKTIEKILSVEPINNILNSNKIFSLRYEGVVPKTSRLLLRDENYILRDTDIPWKSVRFVDNAMYTKIMYEITDDEYSTFISDLNLILKRETKDIKEWVEDVTGKTHIIDLICKLNRLDKNEPIVSKPEYSYVPRKDKNFLINIVPNARKDIYEIFDYVGIKDTLESEDNKKYIKYNTLLISYENFENLIKNNFSWVITNVYDSVNALGIELPKELSSDKNIKSIDEIYPQGINRNTEIGLIDSSVKLPEQFDNYVSFNSMVDEDEQEDFVHGSEVASLLIANDELNPEDIDGFGNFHVRAFGILSKSSDPRYVAEGSMDDFIFKVPEIINNNTDVKVWNISFGARVDERSMSISPFGKMLDELSEKNDLIFVVASGNDGEKGWNTLSTPADSFNALSVGSVLRNEKNMIEKAPYSSAGFVQGYFKPEVSAFGGPTNSSGMPLRTIHDRIISVNDYGTSFSAPRISRMVAYLIEQGYKPLEAKAKVIGLASYMDSLTRRQLKGHLYGYISLDKAEVDNRIDFHIESSLDDIKPKLWPLKLEGVDELTISLADYVKFNELLDDEYSMSDIEIRLVKYNKNWETLANTPVDNNKDVCVTIYPKWGIKNGLNNPKFETEQQKRTQGKFFSSKKNIYDLTNEKLNDNWEYALYVRRINLIKGDKYERNNESIRYGLVVSFYGDKLDENKFIKENDEVVEININEEINIEAQ